MLPTLRQLQYLKLLAEHGSITIGDHAFISPLAMVDPDTLTMGENSLIAAHAYVTGTIIDVSGGR